MVEYGGLLIGADEEEEEQDFSDASVQDGVPRYGQQYQPTYAGYVSEAAELGRRTPENLISPMDPREPGQAYGSLIQADDQKEQGYPSYMFNSPKLLKADPDETPYDMKDVDPVKERELSVGAGFDDLKYLRNTANFLFGEDLAIMGIKWDEYGFDISMENLMDQWADHPVMSTISLAGLVASTVFPAIGAVRKSAKVGMLAQSGKTKFVSEVLKRHRIGEKLKYFDAEAGKYIYRPVGWRSVKGTEGIIKESSLLRHGDDWHATFNDLLDIQDEAGQGLKHFQPEVAAKYKEMLATGRGDDAINMFGGKDRIKKLLLDQDVMNKRAMLKWKVDNDMASVLESKRYELEKYFHNAYYQLSSVVTPGVISKITEFMDNGKFWKPFAFEVPEEHHKAWTMAMSGVIRESDDAFKAIKRDPELYKVWQAQKRAYQQHHTHAQDIGFLTKKEVRDANLPDPSLHIKAETGKGGRVGWSSGAVFRLARQEGSEEFQQARALSGVWGTKVKAEPTLVSPSLQARRKYRDWQALKEGYESGELVSDPGAVSQFSLMHDAMVVNTYDQIAEQAAISMKLPVGVTDKHGWFKAGDTVKSYSTRAQKQWIDMNNLDTELEALGYGPDTGMADRLKRMIAIRMGRDIDDAGKIVGDSVELPWMNARFFEEMFHPEHGVFGATEQAIDAMALAGGLHKTSKTALSPRTHVTNLAGNFIMLTMAGKNPFSKQSIKDAKQATDLFRQIARRKINDNIDPDLLFSPDELASAMQKVGFDRFLKTHAGTEVDMVDILAHPTVQQLIEKQAFETAEGMGQVRRILDAIDSASKNSSRVPIASKLTAKMARALTGIGKPGPKGKMTKGIEWMSNFYMMEDMVPKMMYFQDLIRGGMSIDSAVLEVGRRLPQYKTVGRSIQGARRRFLPWITFPAEMTRIMRNNLMDYPLRTAALLRTPQALQSIFQDTLGPATQAEVTDGMREAPMWAQKGTSVLLNGGFATQATLAGGTGAFIGSVLGGAKAGTLGAMVGAGAGGIAGVAASKIWQDSDEEHMRAWTMDFLPWGALQPGTMSPEGEPEGLKDFVDISPVEPYAVLMPIVNVMFGQDKYGREMPTTGKVDTVSKSLMAFGAFLAPTIMQKYGMRVGTPDSGLFDLSQAGTRLGAAAIGAGLGYAGGGAGGAALGGAIGGLMGANTSKLEEDLGLKRNLFSGQTGNPVYDIGMNSFLGIGVSYKATPETRMFNERDRRARFEELRKVWQKQVDYAIQNGNDDMMNHYMAKIGGSFTAEYLEPGKATEKFGEYVKRRWDKLGRHPQLRSYSIEQLNQMLEEAVQFAIKHRTEAMKRRVQAIREELLQREMARESSGLNVGGYDFDINTATGLRQYMPLSAKRKSIRGKTSRSGLTRPSIR